MKNDSEKRIFYSLVPILLFLLVVWMVFILQWGFQVNWNSWGIEPRTLKGLRGIFCSPFLHQNFSHLISNTIPMLILGWFLFYFYKKNALSIFLVLWLGSGLSTWCIARGNIHIGASSIVYGLVFFLFFSGILQKDIRRMAIALITVFLYGGLVWNMLPFNQIVNPSISWEGHLSGALVGFLASILFYEKPLPQLEVDDEEEDDYEIKDDYPENDSINSKEDRDNDTSPNNDHQNTPKNEGSNRINKIPF